MAETVPLYLHDILRQAAENTPGRPALTVGERTLTFAETQEMADRLASALVRRGVAHGDRVTWWADVAIEAPPLYYALASIGAVFVPLNPRYHPAEADAIVDLVEPVLRVADAGHDGDVSIDELLGEGTPERPPEPEGLRETDPEVIFCTSGTTGTPKGVVLSHRSNRMRTSGAEGSVMTMFPMFHWGGWSFLHNAWATGAETVLPTALDAESLLGDLARRRVNRFYAIPGVMNRIIARGTDGYDVSALREANTGTSATPPELLRAIAATFPGTTTSIGYGATEAGGLTTLRPHELFDKVGSVGIPLAGVRTRIVDGELWVKTAAMSLGYWNNPAADADAWADGGWYRTGDVVERDADGYLYVRGRFKDLIRTGGEFVAPPEVDEVIKRLPDVVDGAVAGVPHVDWGEVVVAFVVVRPGSTVTLEEVRRHCGESLASHKHPRQLFVVDEIPRTGPTGQVQRRHLTELALARTSGADPVPAV